MREIAESIWKQAIAAVEPQGLVHSHLQKHPVQGRRVAIFAVGKAAIAMAQAAAEGAGDRLAGGVVVSNQSGEVAGLEVVEASHPVPDARSLAAADRVMEQIGALEYDRAIFLLSGGASALLEKPAPGLSLEVLQKSVKALLACGAPIEAINCVRKHLSAIKGGRLASAFKVPVDVLVMSDVIGDDLEAIGSAPLFFDRTTFGDALAVVARHGAKLPPEALAYLEKGAADSTLESPKAPLPRITHHLIGTNQIALKAAAEAARAAGFTPLILTDRLEAEAKEAGRMLTSIAKGAATGLMGPPPLALIVGGECTVTLRGKGHGGRNQEMALAALMALKAQAGIALAFGGSDGIDGRSHAAGAAIDAAIYHAAVKKGLDPLEFLNENNSTAFFEAAGGLMVTGPSGTNVMDVGIILVGDR
jgi:hydroxypyruvate reductase/glycerate 2-kinase